MQSDLGVLKTIDLLNTRVFSFRMMIIYDDHMIMIIMIYKPLNKTQIAMYYFDSPQ